LGLNWSEATALMGVHTLGRAKASNSGYDGFWASPSHSMKFNNQYFIAMIAESWCPEYNVGNNSNKHQWQRCDVGRDLRPWKEMMLNTDMALAYADSNGDSLVASPENTGSHCCAWVHSFNDDYNMTKIIANNGNSFCNTKCSDYKAGKCGKKKNKKEEFLNCCQFDGRDLLGKYEHPGGPMADCQTPGLNGASMGDDNKFWSEKGAASAPAVEDVRVFSEDEDKWMQVFLNAWKKVTENGHSALKSLSESC